MLLSSSTDRGVIVWKDSKDGLLPTLANVKETKANIDAVWNHKGNKFAVATASGNVFIGVYSEENAFWLGSQIGMTIYYKTA